MMNDWVHTRSKNRRSPIFSMVFSSLWKRKLLLLVVIIVTSFAIVALQYSSVSRNKHGSNDPVAAAHKQSGEFGPQSTLEDFVRPRSKLSPPLLNDKLQENDADGKSEEAHLSNEAPRQNVNSAFDDNNHALDNTKENESNQARADSKPNFYVPGFRYVHFDLKGAPPKIDYLISILPLLKSAGANGILIEYEDMFPYKNELASIAAKNAYSEREVEALSTEIRKQEMEVIPLVPTFGHLEFVLKLENFRHLREVDHYPMALCPSKNESFLLVQKLIDQMMALHKSSKWLHIGCDEVFQMSMCNICRYKDRESLYLEYVVKVAKYVREKHKVTPIIWDDMLRNFSPEKMRESKLGQLVEPMIWIYVKDIYRFLPYPTFSLFSEVFDNIWAASAFKGAYGETLTVPNVKMHLENNQGWLETMSEQHKNFKNFRGIVVTGWQRYDHLATLCELLPSGLPSLIVDLITLKNGHFNRLEVFKEFTSIMRCPDFVHFGNEVDLDNDPYLYNTASRCDFPGVSVFRMTQTVSEAVKRVNEYLYDVSIHKAWLTDYNIRHNVSNPYRVDEGFDQFSNVHYILNSAFKAAATSLSEVFDKYTVYEWIEQNIYPYLLKLDNLQKNAEILKKAKTWPARPYEPLKDLDRFGLKKLLKQDHRST